MARRRLRARSLDAVILTVAIACLSTPFMAGSTAAPHDPLLETGMTIDQRVRQSGLISYPLNAAFDVGRSGKSTGKIDWDVYSSSAQGFKLSISADGTPAMRDDAAGASIADYGASPSAWSVGAGDRRFGFSATGTEVLNGYDGGTKWRGFVGRRSIEVARRTGGAAAATRTTVKLAAEMNSALPAKAKPKAWIVATAMTNL